MRNLVWTAVLMFTWPAYAELRPCPKTLNPGQPQTYTAYKCVIHGCRDDQLTCDGKPWAQSTTKLHCEPLPGVNCAMTGDHVCIPGKGCLSLGPYDENGNERKR
jgi:hypothetical protein